MLPCSPDYIFAFASGVRGQIIVSALPSRYTFRTPEVITPYMRGFARIDL